jgi:hypothetical protein
MLDLLKRKKATPREFAEALLHCVKVTPEEDKFLFEGLNSDAERQRVLNEAIYLQIFTIDYVVFTEFGNTVEKKVILDEFFDLVEAGMKDPNNYRVLMERIPVYEAAVKKRSDNIVQNVGLVFAKCCGKKDIIVATDGGVLFALFFKMVSDLVRKWRKRTKIVLE